jgi:hypothetical protein
LVQPRSRSSTTGGAYFSRAIRGPAHASSGLSRGSGLDRRRVDLRGPPAREGGSLRVAREGAHHHPCDRGIACRTTLVGADLRLDRILGYRTWEFRSFNHLSPSDRRGGPTMIASSSAREPTT